MFFAHIKPQVILAVAIFLINLRGESRFYVTGTLSFNVGDIDNWSKSHSH